MTGFNWFAIVGFTMRRLAFRSIRDRPFGTTQIEA